MKKTIYNAAIAGIFALSLSTAFAQDAKAIEKDLNSELRQAQSAFFNGRLSDSEARLKRAAELLETLKKLDPHYKQLPAIEQKLGKQQAELAKKLAKGATAAPETAGTVDAAKSAAPTGQSAKTKALPRKTAQEMRELTRTLDSLERFEKDRMLRLQQGNDPERLESILGEIAAKVTSLKEMLARVSSMAAEEKAEDHPEFVAVKERTATVSVWAGTEIETTRTKAAAMKDGQAASAEAGSQLQALYDRFNDQYFTPLANLSYEHDQEKIARGFELLSEYEGKTAELGAALADFEGKFGSSREAIDAATGDQAPGRAWENMKKAMESTKEVAGRLAGKVVETLEAELAELPKRHDFFRLEKHATIKQLAEFARKNVPDYAGLATVDSRLAEDIKAFEAKVAERSWPACKGKDADRADALAYLQNSWGKDEKHAYQVLATVITGEWSVQKHDLLGRPIMFGLPVLVALQKPDDKDKGMARVFSLTLRTPENATAAAQPPFESDTVGDSWFIKADRVK